MIVVFQPDPSARARLSDALARDHELQPVSAEIKKLRE